MSEILEEYGDKEVKSYYSSRFVLKLFAIGIVVILFGVYVGDILFGRSSLDVLLGLQSDRDALEQRVHELKQENAALQKEYFELRQLDPDMRNKE